MDEPSSYLYGVDKLEKPNEKLSKRDLEECTNRNISSLENSDVQINNNLCINNLLDTLTLGTIDAERKIIESTNSDSSISEDIKQMSTESSTSEPKHLNKRNEASDFERDRSLNSLDLSDLVIPQFRESEMLSLNASPTKIYLNKNDTNGMKPQEVIFKLELNPEIRFNVDDGDKNFNRLTKSHANASDCSRSLGAVDFGNSATLCLHKRSISLDEFTSQENIIHELDLDYMNIIENPEKIETHICSASQPDITAKSQALSSNMKNRSMTNYPNEGQFCDIKSNNADIVNNSEQPNNGDQCSSRDASNMMQSLVDSIDTGTTSTEYRIMCEEFSSKVINYQLAITDRDQTIQRLTQSLQESKETRKNLESEIQKLNEELNFQRRMLVELEESKKLSSKDSPETESLMDLENQGNEKISNVLHSAHITSVLVNSDIQKFAKTLPPVKRLEFDDIKFKFQLLVGHEKAEMKRQYEEQIKSLHETLRNDKQELENEISHLRQALCEFKDSGSDILQIKKHLQEQHKQEVEALRTYFEKKCADMEKHYSEEVFSQQSRRVSAGSSTDSDIGDLLYNPQSSPKKARGDEFGYSDNKYSEENMMISPIKRDVTHGAGDCPSIDRDYPQTITGKVDVKTTQDSLPSSDLESLQIRFDKNLDQVKSEYEMRLKFVEEKYQSELNLLKSKINNEHNIENISEAIQEVLVKSEQQLQQQVKLVKQDVLGTLEDQIKTLISDKSPDSSKWPVELIQLKNKFTAESQSEIMRLKNTHENEILKLRNDYEKQLNRKMRRNSTFDKNRDLGEVIKERNSLRQVNRTLRGLISELIGYVSECETEINNTLWSNLDNVIQVTDTSFPEGLATQVDDSNLDKIDVNTSSISLVSANRHVHFVPDITHFLEKLQDDSIFQNMDLPGDLDITTNELKMELNNCLDRLKTEASALLLLTGSRSIETICNKKIGDRIHKDEVDNLENDMCDIHKDGFRDEQKTDDEICHAQNISKQNLNYEATIDGLLSRMNDLDKDKQDLIAELIEVQKERDQLKMHLANSSASFIGSNKHEIVSEGYGVHSPVHNTLMKHSTFTELRQRASVLLLNEPVTNRADDFEGQEGSTVLLNRIVDTSLLQLFEDLCREGDKIYDEASQDREDLQSQIEAADKQLRSTRQFLEEQAAEREQERDDFTREISELRSRLKDRDKERLGHDSALKELEEELVRDAVERLENQMRDMSAIIADNETHKQNLEAELRAAMDKISLLGDIIRELENQLEAKSVNEKQQEKKIVDLQSMNEEQYKSYELLTKELLTSQHESDVKQLNEKICNLEDQLLGHRKSTENIEVVLEIKKQIEDIGICLDSKTKQLESLHAAVYSMSCSSEDVSLRDRKISTKINEDQDKEHKTREPQESSSPIAALEHLQLIQDKLQRHSKAEEATLKRIRDLEMQITTLKHTCMELRNERDILQERSQQQINDLSSLQSRLDDQRRRADSIHKQSTSDLHLQIHNLQSELSTVEEQLMNKNRRIQNLEQILEDSRNRLVSSQSNIYDKQDVVTTSKLQEQLEALRKENIELRDKIRTDKINKIALPDLMDTMLEEKNADIELLKEKLDKVTKDLEKYMRVGLNELDLVEIREIKDLQEGTKLSARTLSDIVSISDYDEPDIMRKCDSKLDSAIGNQKPDLMNSPPFSFSNFNLQDDAPLYNASAAPFNKDLDIDNEDSKNANTGIFQKSDSPRRHKLDLIPENEENSLAGSKNPQMQNELECLQKELQEKSEKLLELEMQLSCVPVLKEEMLNLKMNLDETLKVIEDDKQRFETLLKSENMLKHDLENMSTDLSDKMNEITALKNALMEKDHELMTLMREKQDLLDKLSQFEQTSDLKNKLEQLEAELSNAKYDKNQELSTLHDYTELLKTTIKDKSENLNIVNREVREQMMKIEEQSTRIDKLMKDVTAFELQQNVLFKGAKLRDKLQERDNDILHYKELLGEKERIISHMSKDSENLHTALATIQNKLRESGNILDLAVKLKDEMKKNELLEAEVAHLGNMLSRVENSQTIDDIEKLVQKELDVSAKLDNTLIQVISDDDQKYTEDDRKLKELLLQNEMLQIKLDGELQCSIKLTAAKESLLIEVKNYKEKLSRIEETNKDLRNKLESEVEKCNEMQLQDAEIMRAMRVRLEKALDEETRLLGLLEQERSNYKKSCNVNDKPDNLDKPTFFKLIHAKTSSLDNSFDVHSHSKEEQVDVNSRMQENKLTINQNRNKEFEPLEDIMCDALMPEANRLRKDLEIQSEINDRLTSEILLLKTQMNLEKSKVEDDRRLLERERKSAEEEIQSLNQDLGSISAEKKRLAKALYEANQRSIQQHDHIVSLENRMKSLESNGILRNLQYHSTGQEQLITAYKQQELQSQTSNLEMRLISMQNELDRAVEREMALKETLTLNGKGDKITAVQMDTIVPAQFLQKLKDMSSLLEKHVLETQHADISNREYVSMDAYRGAVDKADHAFMKYLRSESYRKALCWQKNYLLLVERSYMLAEQRSRNLLQMEPTCSERQRSPKRRFRIAVLAVSAINRMHFLVRRWQVGKMIGPRVITSSHNKNRHTTGNAWGIPQSPPCHDKDRPRRQSTRDRSINHCVKYDSQDS